ncbi:MAG: hypothetical protein WAV54_05910 [Acidimicrobiales bacterium]
MTSPRQATAAGVAFVALAACGWFAAAMPPFGIESSAVTFSVAAAMLAAGAVFAHQYSRALDLPAREPIRDVSLRLRGMGAWLFAALVVLAVELWELFHSPRSLYPTLSSLANEVLGPGHRVVRAAAFMCWGACGLVVSSRSRRHA